MASFHARGDRSRGFRGPVLLDLAINPNFRPGKHGQNVVAGSDTRALFP